MTVTVTSQCCRCAYALSSLWALAHHPKPKVTTDIWHTNNVVVYSLSHAMDAGGVKRSSQTGQGEFGGGGGNGSAGRP